MKDLFKLVEIAHENMNDNYKIIQDQHLFYKPLEDIFTLGEHLHHISYSIHWCIDNLIENNKYPHEKSPQWKSTAELKNYSDEAFNRWKKKIKQLEIPEEKLVYHLEILDHCTYHRSQMALYLRFLKLQPPAYKYI